MCIGNIHGRYRGEPVVEFDRLVAIKDAVDVPLVLHGASELPDAMMQRAVELGVCKFNVNTEVREVYLDALREGLHGSTPPSSCVASPWQYGQVIVPSSMHPYKRSRIPDPLASHHH